MSNFLVTLIVNTFLGTLEKVQLWDTVRLEIHVGWNFPNFSVKHKEHFKEATYST